MRLENGVAAAIERVFQATPHNQQQFTTEEVKSEECVLQLNDRVLKGGSIWICCRDVWWMGFLVSVSIGWLLEEEEDNLTWWEFQQDEVINKFLAHFVDDGTIIGFVDEEVPMRSINSTGKIAQF